MPRYVAHINRLCDISYDMSSLYLGGLYMTQDEIQQILDEFEFLDSWSITLHLIETLTGPDLFYLQVCFIRADTYTGLTGTGWGRRWLLSDDPTEGEVVFTCWLAIQQILIHEGQETVKYRGQRFISPHMNPQSLVELAKELGV